MKRARYLAVKLTAVFTAAVLPLFLWSAAANAAEPFFMGLGGLPGGPIDSRAYGVSADGSVVVGSGNNTSGSEAFRWTQQTGMVGLGEYSSAYDVSADGSVIVGQWGSQAFRWTQNAGMVGLGDFPGGAFRSSANAVSADGSVVVGIGWDLFCTRGGCQNIWPPFRWTQDSGMRRVAMHIVPVFEVSLPLDISADGSVIVAGRFEAESWTQAGGTVALGDLPGGDSSSQAYGVSADGAVIVGQGTSDAGAEAFRWTQGGGMVGLGNLPGFDFSLAQDVSADGSIVVGSVGFGTNPYAGSNTFAGAFIWDFAHGMRNLNDVLINNFGLGASLAGWNLEYASAISADGRVVVGYGTNPSGDMEAWLARLGVAGDYSGNGTVGPEDYNLWKANYGSTVNLAADGNADGRVNAADYTVWRNSLGATLGAGSGAAGYPLGASAAPLSAAVPEPATLALAVLSLLGLVFGRRRSPRFFSRLKSMPAFGFLVAAKTRLTFPAKTGAALFAARYASGRERCHPNSDGCRTRRPPRRPAAIALGLPRTSQTGRCEAGPGETGANARRYRAGP